MVMKPVESQILDKNGTKPGQNRDKTGTCRYKGGISLKLNPFGGRILLRFPLTYGNVPVLEGPGSPGTTRVVQGLPFHTRVIIIFQLGQF